MKRFIRVLQDKDLKTKILNRLYINIGLFVLPEIIIPVLDRAIDPRYKIVIVSSEHLDLLKKYAEGNRNKEHYEKNIVTRINENERFKGFAVLDTRENEIAYLSWIDFNKVTIGEIHFDKELSNTEAYFFDDDCVRKHQRQGLHQSVFINRLKFCKSMGIKTVYIVVYLSNRRALQSLKKFKFELKKTIKYYPLMEKLFKRGNGKN